MKPIFFDLDGTLTDSGEGIMNCAAAAFTHLGMAVPERQRMRVFVGPPLSSTFSDFGVPAHRIDEAIAAFRARYSVTGKFENFPYPGIPELLHQLQQAGYPLYVATSKPESLAHEVMEHFDLSRYFTLICGATMDSSRVCKEDVISYLLQQIGPVADPIMVGDTVYDVVGAAAHSIPTVGVSWGYGDAAQMRQAGAVSIAHSPQELFEILSSMNTD